MRKIIFLISTVLSLIVSADSQIPTTNYIKCTDMSQQILFVSKRIDQAKNIQFENMAEFGHVIQKSILN